MNAAHHYPDRASWLAARRIGASDVAAILGVGGTTEDEPHRSAWDVWARLTGQACPQAETSAMRRGRAWESVVLGAYQGETGRKVHASPNTLHIHPRRAWATASPDAMAWETGGPNAVEYAIEAKTDGSPARRAWGESQEIGRWTEGAQRIVRPDYALQCYYQAWVIGVAWVDLAVLLPWYELRLYRLHADPEVSAALEEQIGAWHLRHVVGGEPPALDRSDACVDWLRDRFPGGEGARVATEAEAEQVRRYAALKAAIREAEKEAGELKAQLLAAAGNADVVALEEPRTKRDGSLDLKGVPRLTIIRSEREGGLDVPRLLAEHPEIDAERYRKPPSVSVSLRPYNLESQ